ncbi:MAG: DUF4163 domain-containing protein [Sphingomicrobium sp.]
MKSTARLTALSALALTACRQPEAGNTAAATERKVAAPATANAPPTAFSIDQKNAQLHFAYAWPAEAAAIPALADRLRHEMALARTGAVATASDDFTARKASGYPWFAHELTRSWSTAGQSPGLLSLVATTAVYTGGAHPNHGSSALPWDRKANREVKLDALFSSPSSLAALLTGPWCKAIAAARAGRRGGVASAGDPFDECPPLSDLAIVPADSDHDGRFDRFRLLADPYVAGPYAEGDYEIDFAVEPRWIAAIKPGWRGEFEVQPQ